MEGLKNHVMHRQKVFQVEYSLNPHLSKVYVSYTFLQHLLISEEVYLILYFSSSLVFSLAGKNIYFVI